MREGWTIKPLGEVGTFQRGGGFLKNDFVEDGFPCIHYGQIHTVFGVATDKHLKCIPKTLALHKSKLATTGDVILAITSEDVECSCKCTAWLGNYDIAIGSHAAIYHHNLNPKFVSYYFRGPYFNRVKQKFTHGIKVIEIKPSDIATISIAYPSFEEQTLIVEELDILNNVIAEKESQLKDLDALAQSIFYEMFGNPVANEKGWEKRKLGDVCTIERGGSPRPIQDFLTDAPDGINWIKIGDAVAGSKYISSTAEKIRPEGMRKSRFVHKGDFILSNSMSFGKPYILAVDGCIHDGWLVLRDNDDTFDKNYLYYYLSSPDLYNEFKRLAVGGVVNNLNSGLVRGGYVSIPPKKLQEEFAKRENEIESQRVLVRDSIKEVQTLLDSRMNYYFAEV